VAPCRCHPGPPYRNCHKAVFHVRVLGHDRWRGCPRTTRPLPLPPPPHSAGEGGHRRKCLFRSSISKHPTSLIFPSHQSVRQPRSTRCLTGSPAPDLSGRYRVPRRQKAWAADPDSARRQLSHDQPGDAGPVALTDRPYSPGLWRPELRRCGSSRSRPPSWPSPGPVP
jgi:hypothetical protein